MVVPFSVPQVAHQSNQWAKRPAKPNRQGKDRSNAAVIEATEFTIRRETEWRLAKPPESLQPAPSEFVPHVKRTEHDQLNADHEIDQVLCDAGDWYQIGKGCGGQGDGAKQQDHQCEPPEAIELH